MHHVLYSGRSTTLSLLGMFRLSLRTVVSRSHSTWIMLTWLSASLPQAFHSAHDAQLLMDSVPPDKRLPTFERFVSFLLTWPIRLSPPGESRIAQNYTTRLLADHARLNLPPVFGHF